MVLGDIFERFAEQSPVTVMARAALEHALSPQVIDALFEQTAQRQYTRTLLFSSVVDLMGTVVAKIQPAVNAAYRARAETLGVSLKAVYDKLDRTEPGISAELLRHTARTLGPVITSMAAAGARFSVSSPPPARDRCAANSPARIRDVAAFFRAAAASAARTAPCLRAAASASLAGAPSPRRSARSGRPHPPPTAARRAGW